MNKSSCRWSLGQLGVIAVLVGGGMLHAQELTWIESANSTRPSGRCCAAMAFDFKQDATVFFGGFTPDAMYDDTWIWRNGWSQLAPSHAPSARQGPAMVWDAAAEDIVLFGGTDSSGNYLNDTWIWNGKDWTEQHPPISPPGRRFDGQGMTYDAETGSVVLFGGIDASGYLGDTWSWSGITRTWTQHFPEVSPSPRRTMLAYDYLTRTVVLFGGDDSVAQLGDTWTWDGRIWTQHFPVSAPSARGLSSFAWDSSLAAVVLFGGTSGPNQNLGDTWVWNGLYWTEVVPAHNPPGRFAAPMDYDYASRALLLFGGFSTYTLDDTWLLERVSR